jgi:hypothetical protein
MFFFQFLYHLVIAFGPYVEFEKNVLGIRIENLHLGIEASIIHQ